MKMQDSASQFHRNKMEKGVLNTCDHHVYGQFFQNYVFRNQRMESLMFPHLLMTKLQIVSFSKVC